MKKILIPIILILLLLTAVFVAAQGGYELPWWSVDGGAKTSSGDGFTLNGIIGQPDAGEAMTGGDFAVSGGYWAATDSGVGPIFKVLLPSVMK